MTGALPEHVAPAGSVPTEEHRNCAWRTGALDGFVQRLAEFKTKSKTEQAQPPQTLAQIFDRSFGDNSSSAAAQYARGRAEADKLNADLKTAGCAPLDIDERIAQIQATPPPPPVPAQPRQQSVFSR
ncbi:MAG: hypothetical protein JSS20_18590 [Proteobacteria bacterium]|nr:hypothetical protein [Pseudomonadota bacterium]